MNKLAFMRGFAGKARKFGKGLMNTPAVIGGGLGFGMGAIPGAAISYNATGGPDDGHTHKEMAKLRSKLNKGLSGLEQGSPEFKKKKSEINKEMETFLNKRKKKNAIIGGLLSGGLVGLRTANSAARATGGWGSQKQWFNAGGNFGGGGRARSYGSATAAQAKKILGLGDVKTKAEAKKKFRQAAMKHHPDRGGSHEAMQKVNDAWEAFQNSSDFKKLAKKLLGL